MHQTKTTRKDVDRGLVEQWFLEQEQDAQQQAEEDLQPITYERDSQCSQRTRSLT